MRSASPPAPSTSDWKLIKFWAGPHELFDLSKDLGEEKNLAPDMPEKVEELDALLLKQLVAGEANLPRKNPDHAAR